MIHGCVVDELQQQWALTLIYFPPPPQKVIIGHLYGQASL